MIASGVGCVLRRLLSREGRSLTRSSKSQRSGALPAERVPNWIRDRHDGVVERGLNEDQTKWHILSLTLFELLVLGRFSSGASLLLCH
jgi:hypothetical protein